MKKLFYLFSFLFILLCIIPTTFAQETPIQYKQYIFKGALLKSTDPGLIGPENYQTLKNLEYTNDGLTITSGYSKINTTALTTYTKIRNGAQLRVDRTVPSYVLAQAYDSSGNSRIYQNQTTIPSQGDFEATQLHTDASGAGIGRFSAAPQGIAYANGVETMGWWGEEHSAAAVYVASAVSETDDDIALNDNGGSPDTIVATADSFLAKGFRIGQIITISNADTAANDGNYEITDISSDGLTISIATGSLSGTDAAGASTVTIAAEDHAYFNPIDYSEAASSALTTVGNLVILGGGIDDETVLMLHMNGIDGDPTFTDESFSAHSPAAQGGMVLDTDYQKFGTASGVFDGSGDYIQVADHADWNKGTGKTTIDFWARFSDTTECQVLYAQSDTVNGDIVVFYFYNDTLNFFSTDNDVEIFNESFAWSPSINTWYHISLVRGWGGVADDWAVTVNGTSVGTFTDAGTWPDVSAVITIGGATTDCILDLAGGHPINRDGDAVLSTSTYKFGDGSLYFDGSGDYIYSPDSSDWDLFASDSTDRTIELWIKHSDHAGDELYIGHFQDATNYWEIFHRHGGAGTDGIRLVWTDAGSTEVNFDGAEITDTDWHWIVLAKVGDEYGLYIDGIQSGYVQTANTININGSLRIGGGGIGSGGPLEGYIDGVRIYNGNPFSAAPNNTPDDDISGSIPTSEHTADANTALLINGNTKGFKGWLDEWRDSKGIARWEANYTVPVRAYQETQRRFYLFSTRPLQGFKAYISTANTEASTTLSGWEWTGKAFSSLDSSLVDGTSSGGITMAQTGTVTWASTEDTTKQWYFEGLLLYAYMFEISDGGAEISQITVDAAFQKLPDNWDGSERTPVAVQMWDDSTKNWDDWTLEVIQESTDPAYPIGAELVDDTDLMTSNDYLVLMFEERITAIHIEMIGGRANTAAVSPTIYYHNGRDWVTVGNVLDTTATRETDYISLSQTGVWSWNAPVESDESPRFMFGSTGYVYKVQFDGDLAGSGDAPEVVMDLVTGIPAQYTVPPVAFTSQYKNQLLLAGHNQTNEGNRVDFSMPGQTDVWNGELSSMNGIQSLYFGGPEALVTGQQIYNKYGSRLITGWFGLKHTSAYMLTGDSPEDYVIYPVSETLGCPAPLTLVSADAAYTVGQNINRHVLLWLSYAGPMMFDGSTILPLKGIENYFDPAKTEYIKTSIIDRSRAAYDPRTNCFHLLFPSGSAATDINTWMVYDLTRQKWYELEPTTYPQSIWYVADEDGIGYLYGGLDTGYVMRLDNGTTWDGSAIVVEVETGDFLPIDVWHTTLIRKVKVFADRISEDVDMSVYHYGDTASDDSTVDLTFPLDSGSDRLTWTAGRLGANADELGLFKRFKFKASFSNTSDWSLMGYGYGYQDLGIRD